MSEENKAVVRREMEEVFNHAGDLDAADEIYAPDYVDHEPTTGNIRGIEGAKQFAVAYREAFPDLETTREDQVAEGDKVVSRFTVSGTHRGEIMGAAPTGKLVTHTGHQTDRISGGKIVESWTNWDALGLLQEIGAIPSPG